MENTTRFILTYIAVFFIVHYCISRPMFYAFGYPGGQDTLPAKVTPAYPDSNWSTLIPEGIVLKRGGIDTMASIVSDTATWKEVKRGYRYSGWKKKGGQYIQYRIVEIKQYRTIKQ